MKKLSLNKISQKKDEAYSFIQNQKDRRQTNKILHSHPSPVFWRERNISVDQLMNYRTEQLQKIPKDLNLYVGIPYCLKTNPKDCGYCLFPHEDYCGTEMLDDYLDYLKIESEMFRDYITHNKLASIYIGGGTPNLLKPEMYIKLLNIIRDIFPTIPEGIEITLEGVPQLYTLEKLNKIKEAGITRISIGVQQLDDNLIKLSGRKQKSEHVLKILEWCNKLGLKTSVDLIFGWPGQTVNLMLQDLDTIVRTGITHITHYELNVGGRSYFARNMKNELPTIAENLELFLEAKSYFESHGFAQITTYDWEKVDSEISGEFVFEKNMRTFFSHNKDTGITGNDMWGLGFAGISYFMGTPESPGWALMNSLSMKDYVAKLEKGDFPVERGYKYQIEDIPLCYIFQSLQSLIIDKDEYNKIFRSDINEEFYPIWCVLQDLNWVEISDEAITLVGDGIYFTPLIQSLLALKRRDEIRRSHSFV